MVHGGWTALVTGSAPPAHVIGGTTYGSPPVGPFKVPGLRDQINLVEYAVHHEDVSVHVVART